MNDRPWVLLMDDEESILEVTTLLLERKGFSVVAARDGSEAVDRYRDAFVQGRPFDVVIMDLTVPDGMGGLEAMERIREIDTGAKGIVSSGYTDPSAVSEYAKYGFVDVIPKPYQIQDLIAVINRHITR